MEDANEKSDDDWGSDWEEEEWEDCTEEPRKNGIIREITPPSPQPPPPPPPPPKERTPSPLPPVPIPKKRTPTPPLPLPKEKSPSPPPLAGDGWRRR